MGIICRTIKRKQKGLHFCSRDKRPLHTVHILKWRYWSIWKYKHNLDSCGSNLLSVTFTLRNHIPVTCKFDIAEHSIPVLLVSKRVIMCIGLDFKMISVEIRLELIVQEESIWHRVLRSSSIHNTLSQTRAAGMIRNQNEKMEKWRPQMCKSITLRV